MQLKNVSKLNTILDKDISKIKDIFRTCQNIEQEKSKISKK